DTSYRVTAWGIWNDTDYYGTVLEDNHSQFIVTATSDGTDVTIMPSVLALGGHPANVPINVRLNKGECYIVKADSTGIPNKSSLNNSTVSATKPVSVITAVNCAYNPQGVESCQEVIDELMPRRIVGTTFYVPVERDQDIQNVVLFTSDIKNF